jgi:SAM-dependent methyltransferase
VDLTHYRLTTAEQQRTDSLLQMMPLVSQHALDIGARDGHFSRLMAQRYGNVTALDLSLPNIAHPDIECVAASVVDLPFPDDHFSFVFCAEVLEHIPPDLLQKACSEIQRVCSGDILIGVPYRQDIRLGRVTCRACGQASPPWGHVNAFTEHRLWALFSGCEVVDSAFIGSHKSRTNWLSAVLMDYAGNPYGTYDQDEPCIHCGSAIAPPPARNFPQLIATRLAFWAHKPSVVFSSSHAKWIHMRFSKRARS